MSMLFNHCAHCGVSFFGNAHYCREHSLPDRPRAVPLHTLTEADVRRIVREELARARPTTYGVPSGPATSEKCAASVPDAPAS